MTRVQDTEISVLKTSFISSVSTTRRLGPAVVPPVTKTSPSQSNSQSSSDFSVNPSDSNNNSAPGQNTSQESNSNNLPNTGRPLDTFPNSDSSSSNGNSQTDSKSAAAVADGKKAEKKSETNDTDNLSPAERRKVQKLKRIDAKVRAHEQAHLAAAGQFAQGGPSFEFKTGPDGKQYAVGGEVSLDTGKEDDPQETIQKMQQVKSAALAPANPSPQDMKVAREASQKLSQARQEKSQENSEQGTGQAQGNPASGSGQRRSKSDSPDGFESFEDIMQGAGDSNQQTNTSDAIAASPGNSPGNIQTSTGAALSQGTSAESTNSGTESVASAFALSQGTNTNGSVINLLV